MVAAAAATVTAATAAATACAVVIAAFTITRYEYHGEIHQLYCQHISHTN
jgi:hypothetical protein